MEKWGILSSKVLYFEREADGKFRRQSSYPKLSLASVNTHDLPTIAGFWTGRDVELRTTLGLIDSARAGAAAAEREVEKQALVDRLREDGALPLREVVAMDASGVPAVKRAVHDFLCAAPPSLVGLSLDDLGGETEPVNVPGVGNRPLSVLEPQDAPHDSRDRRHERGGSGRMHESRAPTLRATYRLQLHAGFTLRDATAVVPYLHELGISHVYASPILAARAGSRHGYDATDPRRINPELGSEDDLKTLTAALHERGMGFLVDIVPNHMAAGPENPYWEDVLSHGERSRYAKWFDIDWRMHPDHRVVLPILRDELDAVIARGELRVEVKESGARLIHFDTSVPISPDTEPESLQLAQWDPAAESEAERLFAGRDGEGRLRALLDAQHYRLVAWRRGAREINYRRFFDVNDLVALRAEDPAVFDETHELILRLVGEGVIDALRVDHIDGLRDPAAYLARLRGATDQRRSGGVPIVVEKILMYGERLRDSWPVDGTTGYERLNDIEDLFVHPDGFARDRAKVPGAVRRSPELTFESTVRADKRAVLDRAFAADVTRLARLLDELLKAEGSASTREQIYHGIEEFIAAFPVYRSYVDASGSVHPDDERILKALAAHGTGADATVANTIAVRRPERSEGGGLGGENHPFAEFTPRFEGLRATVGDRVHRPHAAAHRAGDGQGNGGYGALRVRAARLAKRSRRRAEQAARRRGRELPRRERLLCRPQTSLARRHRHA